MQLLKCKMCGGDIQMAANQTYGTHATFPHCLYHNFSVEAVGGPVLLRKVSRCNDDHFYNRFMSRPGTPPLLRRTKCPTVCSATNIRLLG